MKVVLLITASLESPAGLRYLPMAEALAERGHTVSLLALHHDLNPTTPRVLDRQGVKVRYVGQMHVRKANSRKYYYSTARLLRVVIASTWQMIRQLAQTDCDLLHLGKPQPINGLAGLVGARLLRRRPMFVDCDDYEAVSNRFDNAWLRRAIILFEDGLPRLASGLTVNTRYTEARYRALGVSPERIAFVPNGIDRRRFSPPAEERLQGLRRHWELEGRPVIGYIGSMSLTGHAVDLLLEAFAMALASHPDTVLMLVGGGEDYELLRSIASSLDLDRATRFTGWVKPEAIPSFLAVCDATVDPVKDNLVARARAPLKIVESLAMGIPVVTGDVGDRRETLLYGRAGLLVPPGSAEALAEGLSQILAEPGLAHALASGALEQREQFFWDQLIDTVIDLYNKQGARS